MHISKRSLHYSNSLYVARQQYQLQQTKKSQEFQDLQHTQQQLQQNQQQQQPLLRRETTLPDIYGPAVSEASVTTIVSHGQSAHRSRTFTYTVKGSGPGPGNFDNFNCKKNCFKK